MTAKEIANEVVPDDYKNHAHDVFEKAANKLLNQGFSTEETVELLSDLREAVADSYGD